MKKLISIYFVGTLLLALGACSQHEDLPGKNGDDKDSAINRITVSVASMPSATRTDDGDDPDGDDSQTTDKEQVDEFNPQDYIPFTLGFDENSVIFVSQQTEDIPAFQTSQGIYEYTYMPYSDDANWDEGYNFEPADQYDPLEWYKISAGGSYRGGFALYALYFPKSNQIIQSENNGLITYSVQQDQSTLENLIKSDILGAYHSSPTLFTRLRFRLFHLMTYVRIRLYVPVYNPTSKTGFYDDALISSSLDHVTPSFAVEWSAYRSSDTEGPAISALQGDGNIIMYQHPLPEGTTEREPIQIKYTDFVPKDYFEQPIEGDYDEVRVYDFSVIMPMQKGEQDENGDEILYSSTNFLNFILKSNSGAPLEYYFNQSMSANSTDSNLELKQGNFQYMELYVPRVGNKIIYVGGKINPWNHRATSFPLTPSEVE